MIEKKLIGRPRLPPQSRCGSLGPIYNACSASCTVIIFSLFCFQIMEKYDPQLEADVIMWINAILGDGTMQGAEGPTKVREVLKDGQILCK